MFSKKKDLERFKTTVLMKDYLVEGFCPISIFDDLAEDNDFGLFIYEARIRPVGNLNGEIRTFDKWRIRDTFDNVIAILIEDAVGENACREAFEGYEESFPITVYSGPFIIQGSALSEEDDPEWLETMSYAIFPVKDASIACRIPKSDFQERSSSILLINVSVCSGFNIEGK